MNCAEVKKEMEILAQGLKIGVQDEIRSEDFADKEAERINKIFLETFEGKLTKLFGKNTELVNSFNISQKKFFYGSYEYYDESKGEDYQQLFYQLHLDWFKTQQKILHHDCGGYELDYDLSSELEKFFSESPERRRERLEEPLEEELEEIDNQIEKLEDKKRANTFYEVKFDKEVFEDFITKIESLTYEN